MWFFMSTISAFFFVVAGICAVSALGFKLEARAEERLHGRNGLDRLDPDFLYHRWQERQREGSADLASVVFAVMAWFCALPPIMTAVHANADAYGSARVSGLCFQLAITLVLVDLIFEAGMVSASQHVLGWSTVFPEHTHDEGAPAGVDAHGEGSGSAEHSPEGGHFEAIQALELAYYMATAHDYFAYAIDDLFVSLAMFATALFCRQCVGALPTGFGKLSLLAGGLMQAAFWSGMLRHADRATRRAFTGILAFVYALLHFIVLPIWIGWLGLHLSRRVDAALDDGMAEVQLDLPHPQPAYVHDGAQVGTSNGATKNGETGGATTSGQSACDMSDHV
mmetsp:Transcript_2958/g.8748  ORF Transcript_2958/g.8748 Transcript_2958/m.8748 type:complete len:337 (+) Transcript_2958:1-1011(+)